ncbi:MAG: pyridoxal 5'-phosphate synthase glutaminase subunit PdxT [Chloroflexota bacterium]
MGGRGKSIGILALQGAYAEHGAVLERLGMRPVWVRLPKDLHGLDALILPGGESTTIGRLMSLYGLCQPLMDLAKQGLPILGTCAGLIMLSKKASALPFPTMGLMDVEIKRNAYGRQVDSFEAKLDVPALGEAPYLGVFIRAPVIESVGEGVEVLAQLDRGLPVAVRQGNLVGATFHPELTRDFRFHAYFLNLIS